MSEPFLAEIRIFGFDFAPRGWAWCDGQILPINQNQALYSLLGTTYGGDGRVNFALPDLRGRVPIHRSDQHSQGEQGGAESVALSAAQIASHVHVARATTSDADTQNPSTGVTLGGNPSLTYKDPTNLTPLADAAISPFGGGQGHENRQPYRALAYAMALQGLFPSRN
jgi:microcystin-dependent protein